MKQHLKQTQHPIRITFNSTTVQGTPFASLVIILPAPEKEMQFSSSSCLTQCPSFRSWCQVDAKTLHIFIFFIVIKIREGGKETERNVLQVT